MFECNVKGLHFPLTCTIGKEEGGKHRREEDGEEEGGGRRRPSRLLDWTYRHWSLCLSNVKGLHFPLTCTIGKEGRGVKRRERKGEGGGRREEGGGRREEGGGRREEGGGRREKEWRGRRKRSLLTRTCRLVWF
jgi:hypothetical protein